MSQQLNGYSIETSILCEQIREEIRNKVSIIGVYSSNIVVGQFPSTFPISLYLELDAQRVGKIELHIRFVTPGPNTVGMKIDGELSTTGRSFIPMPTMPLICAEAGSVVIEVSDDGNVWHKLMTREIQLGDVDA